MAFIADLHIHSKYSRACSRDCDLEHLASWAGRKGIGLVGTGDFTHPAWFDHLREMLVPAESGVYRLKPETERAVAQKLPPSCRADVRFMLSVEISTIYKRGDRTRKVHHLVYFPDFAAVARFNAALGRIGNLGSDGRPILGLDSRDLLEIVLDATPDGYLVPAHIWTPWFSALGSKSGFDAIADCYVDLADHIFAVETGLSSDPLMNWRVSSLDSYRLVSNSDAHSPPALGREATRFSCARDYFAVRDALRSGHGLDGTIEFFPEEGKYHLDGHRNCAVRLEPEETKAAGERCPECGKPVTVGVLHRVDALADRPEGVRPAAAAGFQNLVALPEIVGEINRVGARSKTVDGKIVELIAALGPELSILTEVPVDDITRVGGTLLGEAISRLRRGEVIRDAGYDGEYGVIRLFQPRELDRPAEVPALFDVVEPATPVRRPPAPKAPARKAPARPSGKASRDVAEVTAAVRAEHLPRQRTTDLPLAPAAEPVLTGMEEVGTGLLDRLDTMQRVAAAAPGGPLLVVAGPGTGKTRTLTHRIAYLIADLGVAPEDCVAITFTRRAAEELRERLTALLSDEADHILVTTFHGLGLAMLREQPERAGLTVAFRVADEAERLAAMTDAVGSEKEARRLVTSLDREGLDGLAEVRDQYVKALRSRDLVDVDELVSVPAALLAADAELREEYRARWRWLFVDEYQDVDPTQYRLLQLLCPPEGNLCAIGDPDQAIYAFRGADVGFFLRFTQDFPEARQVRLTRNYRSTAPILATALQAVAPSTLVRGRLLEPARRHPDAPLVGLYPAASADDEAGFVARTIDQLVGGTSLHSLDSGRVDARAVAHDGLGFADIAVLYRTDSQARPIVDALTRAGVPVQKRSHDRLVDRPGVAALAHEVRVVAATGPVADRLRLAARALTSRLSAVPESDVHAAVDTLLPLATACGDDLERFRTALATGAEVDTWDPRADRVTLLTLHAAKGLEFPVVFLVGCEDGLLPLRFPGRDTTPDEVAEERRLFFVGITRAQDRLFLSHAHRRTRHGTERTASPSPFFDAVDASLFDRLGREVAPRRPRDHQLRLM